MGCSSRGAWAAGNGTEGHMGNRDDGFNSRMRNDSGGGPSRSGGDRGGGFGVTRREGGYDEHAYASPSPYQGGHPAGGYEREGGFIREDRFGHTPGQRWSGGYGGDVDRDRYRMEPSAGGGRGFTGSDFAGSGGHDRGRHFGNEVDRGGRMGHREHDGAGYGFHGTDMGMGAHDADADRGPHYGKGPKGYKRSDERTREDVCDAIAYFGHVDATDVEVKVEDGIVTLSGTVGDRRDKRTLEHVIERCRGVHDIHNELRVKRDAATGKLGEAREMERDSASGNHRNGKTAPT